MNATREKQLQEKIQFYETVLNNILNGAMITDPEGKVIFFSESYGRFLGVDPQKQIGLHTTEVVENSRMHIVAQTGIPEINNAQRIMGHDMVVQRIPIKTCCWLWALDLRKTVFSIFTPSSLSFMSQQF